MVNKNTTFKPDPNPEDTDDEPMEFDLNSRVSLVGTCLQGVVVGRAEYLFAEPAYLVRYASPLGLQEEWWGESALEEKEEWNNDLPE